MKKKKLFEVSLINKTYSRSLQDTTKFYTSDTALELGFELLEVEYNFDSAEVLLLNVDDRSLVTRKVTKGIRGFTYELEQDIVDHFGEWKAQLKFEKDDEIYVSSPVSFGIENDLSNDRPPTLTDVNSWKNLKNYADDLVNELKQAVLEAVANEEARAVTFNQKEVDRQLRFDVAEQSRNTGEQARQQAESDRVTAESKRVEAEAVRVANETERNLASVEEFIKLQDAVGGRNLYKGDNLTNIQNTNVRLKTYDMDVLRQNIGKPASLSFGIRLLEGGTSRKVMVYPYQNSGLFIKFPAMNTYPTNEIQYFEVTGTITETDIPQGLSKGEIIFYDSIHNNFEIVDIKVELHGPTPYTKAPEEYDVVTKDDYYSHIKMMSEYRDNQIAELITAITALGGA